MDNHLPKAQNIEISLYSWLTSNDKLHYFFKDGLHSHYTDIYRNAGTFQQQFKIHNIRDAKGKERTIINPFGALRSIQEFLHTRFLDFLPVHPIATAFRKGQSIHSNAFAHRNGEYSIRMDIKQFYHSIRISDFFRLLDRYTLPQAESTEPILSLAHPITQKPYLFQRNKIEQLVRQFCFYEGTLPLGFLTSPQLANAIMFPLDTNLLQTLQLVNAKTNMALGNFTLTRYADDYVFSSNKRGACRIFARILREVLAKKSQFPRLTIHYDKTRYMSRSKGNTVITGLRVNANKEIRLHPNYKSHVRLLFKHGLKNHFSENILKGHLNYILYTEPAYYQTLKQKFASQLPQLFTRK